MTAQAQDRLEHAADVFAQLPAVKPQRYFDARLKSFHSFADQVGQEPQMRRPRPIAGQITEAEEAMLWLCWLQKDHARLVWLRDNRTPWKPICRERGMSRATATGAGVTASLWSSGG
jgi:hypothetical protein